MSAMMSRGGPLLVQPLWRPRSCGFLPFLADFPQAAHGDAVAIRGGEDPDHLAVAAPTPDDAVGPRPLHAVHNPAAIDQHFHA